MNAIRIRQIILSLLALAATNITKPLWTANITRRVVTHIQVQHVSIAIRQAWQRTEDEMRKATLILWSLLLFMGLKGQSVTENLVGKVSFVSSQNIYVRFKSSAGISAGDTLYIPAGIVWFLPS